MFVPQPHLELTLHQLLFTVNPEMEAPHPSPPTPINIGTVYADLQIVRSPAVIHEFAVLPV